MHVCKYTNGIILVNSFEHLKIHISHVQSCNFPFQFWHKTTSDFGVNIFPESYH